MTKLSDFSEAQLRITLRALISQRIDLEKHVRDLSQNEMFAQMFVNEILEYQQEIKETEAVEIQVAYQLVMVKKENLISSN